MEPTLKCSNQGVIIRGIVYCDSTNLIYTSISATSCIESEGSSHYLVCDANTISNMEEGMSEMLSCVVARYTLKPNKIGAEFQHTPGSVDGILNFPLNPMGGNSHERGEISV